MRDSAKEPDCLPYDLAFKVKLQNDFSSAGLGSFTIQNKKMRERFGEKALFGLEHNNSLWALFPRVADSRRHVSRRRRAAAW
jgi:hypothetical protein